MELIDRAFQLIDEIESRQSELRMVLQQLRQQCIEDGDKNDSVKVSCTEPSEDSSVKGCVEASELAVVDVPSADTKIKEKDVISNDIQQRPDIWKSLTINDRFRFRRELFAGDDSAMTEAIARIGAMGSLAEADEYLSSMPWDSDSEAVGEFMTFVSNYFSRF